MINIKKSPIEIIPLVSDLSYTEDDFKGDTSTMSAVDLQALDNMLRHTISGIHAAGLAKQAEIFPKNEIMLETKLWNFVRLILVRLGSPTIIIDRLIEVGRLKIELQKANAAIEERRRVAIVGPFQEVSNEELARTFQKVKGDVNRLFLDMAKPPRRSRLN